MRSIFNDVFAVVDAETLRVWTGPGAKHLADAPAFDAAHGGAPATTLAAALAALPKARASFLNRLHVLFAHPWAHAVVLPWQTGLWSESAWQAYARALFEARALRMPLAVRVEYARFGQARLAVALHDDVLRACSDASRAAGWQLAGCRDALSAVLRAHAARVRDRECRFVLLQPGVVTCLFRRDGEWVDIVTLPRGDGQRVEHLIGAAVLMSGQPPAGRTYVVALGADGDGAVADADVVSLDASFAGALA